MYFLGKERRAIPCTFLQNSGHLFRLIWWWFERRVNILLHCKMSSCHLSDRLRPPPWNEPDGVLSLLTPHSHWSDLLMLRRRVSGVAGLFWGGNPDVRHCPVLLRQSFWMASHENPTWTRICCRGCTRLHVPSTGTGRHNAVHRCRIHHPYLHDGMASCGSGRVLQRPVDLDQTLRLHWIHRFCNIRPHYCHQQVPLPRALPAPDRHAYVLRSPDGHFAVCRRQPHWWALGEDSESIMKSFRVRKAYIIILQCMAQKRVYTCCVFFESLTGIGIFFFYMCHLIKGSCLHAGDKLPLNLL